MARPPVNAVFILWLRQLKLLFRSRARMIGALGQPTLFLLALGFGLGPTVLNAINPAARQTLPLFFFSSALFRCRTCRGWGGSPCGSAHRATASTVCAARSVTVSPSVPRPTLRSWASSPRSCSQSAPGYSRRSRRSSRRRCRQCEGGTNWSCCPCSRWPRFAPTWALWLALGNDRNGAGRAVPVRWLNGRERSTAAAWEKAR